VSLWWCCCCCGCYVPAPACHHCQTQSEWRENKKRKKASASVVGMVSALALCYVLRRKPSRVEHNRRRQKMKFLRLQARPDVSLTTPPPEPFVAPLPFFPSPQTHQRCERKKLFFSFTHARPCDVKLHFSSPSTSPFEMKQPHTCTHESQSQRYIKFCARFFLVSIARIIHAAFFLLAKQELRH
jgi:hypothetical protein